MAYGSADSGYGAGASVFHPDASHADTIVIPDGDLLFNGAFKRHGPDLVLTGHDGQRHVVPGYFSGEKHPALVAPNGASLSAALVDLLAGSPAPGQYAQAASTTPANPIGKVEKIVGHVVVFRNGVEVALNVGDAVYKGDVIQTGVNSSCGVDFPDGTALNLVANTRMALNDYSYDPNSNSNDALFSLVQGTFAFVAGKVAHTGDMKIETPVATMGIRGTTGFVQEQVATITANVGNVTYSFAVVEDYATHRVGSYEAVDNNPNSPTYGQVVALVSQNGFLTFVTPQGPNLPPIVTTQPMTNSQFGFEQQIIDQLFQILNSGTVPQSTPGVPGSSTPPNDMPHLLQLLQNDNGNTYTFNIANGGYGQTTVTATINGGGAPPNNPGPQNTSNIFIWTAGNGDWTTPTWSQPGVPNAPADTVKVLSGPLAYDANYTIGSLYVAPGVTLDVTGGTLAITNGITSYGTIVIGGDPPAVTASGIVDNFGCIIVLDCATLTLTNALLANEGTMKAVDGGRIFANLATGSANYDLIEAAWGGKIVINAGDSTFDNSGQIVASHHGTVVLTDITVDSSGNWCCPAILVEGSGSQLLIGGTVTLEGCAPVVLSGNCAVISGAWGGGTLYNNATISGYGEIGAGDCNFILVNDGKIDADGHSGQTLVIDNDSPATGNFAPNEMINAGTIEATGCGGLIIENTTIDNSSFDPSTDTITDGHIKVESGSKIGLDNATILQGFVSIACDAELTTAPGSSNEIETANGPTHNADVFTICNFGTIEISDASSLTLASSDAIDNAGTIELQACGDCCIDATTLYFDQGFAELKGGGQITLSDSTENFIDVTQIGDQLTNFDNTISGAGTIGGGGMLLVNNGIIDANDCNPLTLDPVLLTNTGTLEATCGGTLELSNTIVSNEATTNYSFTTLNNPSLPSNSPQFDDQVLAVNNAGTVLGNFGNSNDDFQGFTYSDGSFALLQDGNAVQSGSSAGFNGTVAEGINSSGEVVGYYASANGSPVGFLYDPSNGGSPYTTLIYAGFSGSTVAVGINDSGLIVGNVYVSTNNTEAFIYDSGDNSWSALLQDPNASPGNPANSGTYGLAINNSGEVVGNYYDASGTAHGFIYNNGNGNWTDVTDTSAAAGASAGTHTQAINNSGQVVGYYVDASGEEHGFLYNGGSYTALDDPLGVKGTVAEGINDSGEIVGYYLDASGTPRAFTYSNGVYTDLNNFAATGGSETLAINDAGQIAGVYYDANGSHDFLADPQTGPASYGTITADCGTTIDLDNATIAYGSVNVYGLLNATGVSAINDAAITVSCTGTIEVTDGGQLTIDPSIVTNTGMIEAFCCSTLVLSDTIVCNDGGTIEASGYGAAIDLFDSTIVGGTLETRDYGIIQTPTGATFVGATLAGGDFETNDGVSLNLQGTTTLDGCVMFEGGGTFTLEGHDAEIVGVQGAHATLDNFSGITVAAGDRGSIDSVALTNENNGLIYADNCSTLTFNHDFIVNNGSVGNHGIMSDGGTINFDHSDVDNTGLIGATGGGSVTFEHTHVDNSGGIISDGNGIAAYDGGSVTFKDSTVDNTGVLRAFTSPCADAVSTIYVNNSTINNAGGTISVVGVGDSVQLSDATINGGTLAAGTGGAIEVVAAGDANISILNGAGGSTSTFDLPAKIEWDSSDTVAVVAGEEITIAGLISIGHGHNVSHETPAGDPNATAGEDFAAPGLSPWSLVGEIGTSGTPFEIGTGTTFIAPVSGELILSVNDDNFFDNSGSWKVSVTVTDQVINTGLVQVNAGANLELTGTIDNSGTIDVDGGTSANLEVNETVTLDGSGTVTLDGSSDSIIGASGGGSPHHNTLDNIDDTISGTGTIGDTSGDLALTNTGTIDATGSLDINTEFHTIDNTGMLEATGGGKLTLDSSVDNSHGSIEAGLDSTVDFARTVTGGGATIQGGTLDYGYISDVDTTFDNTQGYGTLILNDPSQFTGDIKDFSGAGAGSSDEIELANATYTKYTERSSHGELTLTLKDGHATVATLTFVDVGGALDISRDGTNIYITDPPATNASSPSASQANDSFVFHTGANGANTGALWDAGTNDHTDWAHTHQDWSQLAGDMNNAVAAEIAQHAESHWHYALHGAEHLH